MMQSYINGAFVFYRVNKSCKPMHPANIQAQASLFGVDKAIVPTYAGDREQAVRAIGQVSSGLSRKGLLFRHIERNNERLLYGIVKEDKDRAAEHLDLKHEYTFLWNSKKPDGIYPTTTSAVLVGQAAQYHALTLEVDAAYQAIRGMICPGDWTKSINDHIRNHCHGQQMRDDGRIYWCPSSSMPSLLNLMAFLESIGIALVICEVAHENTPVVQQAASEGLVEQIEAMQEEVAKFDGTQKPSNYTARLQEIEQLRAKASAYHACLGIATAQVETILNDLQIQVQGLLSVRQRTTVPRSTRKALTIASEWTDSDDIPENDYPLTQHEPLAGDNTQEIPVLPGGPADVPRPARLGRAVQLPLSW